jgi:hypothetical protein
VSLALSFSLYIYMTPAQDPKQFLVLEGIFEGGNLENEIMEEESWMRNHERENIGKESLSRNPAEGIHHRFFPTA